jgi:hypothetical protein
VSGQRTGFERILSALADEEALVVLIGGLAAVLQGVPYVTNDIDFVYALSVENRARLVRAFTPLHPRLRVAGMTDEDACRLPWRWDLRTLQDSPNMTLETDAGSIDLLASVPGIGDYDRVQRLAVLLPAFGLRVPTLDLPGLIASKRALGRPKDLLALPQIEATLRLRELEQPEN